MSDNPFSPRAVFALVLGGGLLFLALLWMLGAGMDQGDANDGGAHVGGKGLTGYAALAQLLEARGTEVHRSRTREGLRNPGLLVLTPPVRADPVKIDAIIKQRRNLGPTLVILPKWMVMRVPPGAAKVPAGWVLVLGGDAPVWPQKAMELGAPILWQGEVEGERWTHGLENFAAPNKLGQALDQHTLQPLVRNRAGQAVAGYIDDGDYPALAEWADVGSSDLADEENRFPVVVVAEPDLLDNYGMGDAARARLAVDLVRLAMNGEDLPVWFDLTLPGHGAGQNLLTLAFTPPFLAATLCLLLAALAVGWRGFARFGPPRAVARAIAFGKTALVSNAAGLLRRARRLHLLGAPYADAARERLAKALALPTKLDSAATEAAIDRALAARSPDARPFSLAAAALRVARRPRELVRAAQELHSLERILTR